MRVYIKTYGCTANASDSAGMRDLILRSGSEVVSDPDEADVVIINTCAVTQHTANSMVRAIRHFEGKRVIVAGCMAAAQREMLNGCEKAEGAGPAPVARVLGIDPAIDDLPLAMTGATAIVSISEGCAGNCSYCIVKIARGNLRSYSLEAILKNVRNALAAGAREILITSQDVGAYGMDTGIRLPVLLKEILRIEGDYRIRLGMMNPFSIADILPEMIETFKDPRIYRFIHIPVQSGSDRILKLMNRPYTSDEYRRIVSTLRDSVPDITLSTDYIVGFPYESIEDFDMTLDDLMSTRPLKVNITRYSRRPGTAAALMPDTLERTKKERSRKLTALHHEITSSFMRSMIGKRLKVQVTEEGKPGTVIARDGSYNMVVIKTPLQPGANVEVEISGSGTTYMVGRVVLP